MTTHELLRTDFPVPFSEIEEALEHSGHWEGELVHATKAGALRTVNSPGAFLKQENAQPVILEINPDISERKQAEETLRPLSAYLFPLRAQPRPPTPRAFHTSTATTLPP